MKYHKSERDVSWNNELLDICVYLFSLQVALAEVIAPPTALWFRFGQTKEVTKD